MSLSQRVKARFPWFISLTLALPLIGIPSSIASGTPHFGDLITSVSVGDGNAGSSTHFSHDGLTAYVLNFSSRSITVVNTQTYATRTINLPASPDQGFELSNDEQFFFVSDSGASEVYKINTTTGAVVDTITIGFGFNPEGIISTNNGRYLWVNNYANASVDRVDTQNNNSVQDFSISEGSYAFLSSSNRQYLFAIGWTSGSVSKINVSNGQVQNFPVGVNCRAFVTCGAAVVGDKIWISRAGGISIIDQNTGAVTSQITPGVTNNGGFMATSYDGDKVFLADVDNPSLVHVFDVATETITQSISVANQPSYSVAVSPDGSTLWTTYANSASLVSVSYIGTTKPIINTWGSTPSNDSHPVQVSITDPLQHSSIDSSTLSQITVDSTTTISISGKFNELVRNIQVNGSNIAQGSWVQTENSVKFTVPYNFGKLFSIQIFNGSVPILPLQKIILSMPEVRPPGPQLGETTTVPADITPQAPSASPVQTKQAAPSKITQKINSIKCFHSISFRIVKGIEPKCPRGYVKK